MQYIQCILLERGGWQARPRAENFLREEGGWLGRSVPCLSVNTESQLFQEKFRISGPDPSSDPATGPRFGGEGGDPRPLEHSDFYLSKEHLISGFGPHTGACHRGGGGGGRLGGVF